MLKYQLCFIFFLIALLTACTYPNSQLYDDQVSIFRELHTYIKKETQLSLELDSFILLHKEEKYMPDAILLACLEKTDPISISESREYTVNAVLYALNFFNTNAKYKGLSKDKSTSILDLRFMIGLGAFKDPFTADRIPGDIGDVFLKQGRLFYVERFGSLDTALKEETFTEAIDLLKEQGKIYYPEYLKWVERAESDHSSKLQESQ